MDRKEIYDFLPNEIKNIKLTEDEQELIGIMYLKIKTDSSYFSTVEETNPFKITRNINHLVDMGLINKKYDEQNDEVSYKLSLLGFAVCDIIEENPDKLFDIYSADEYEILQLMANKYFGFSLEKEYYTSSVSIIPAEKTFRFLTSNKEYILESHEDCEHAALFNSDLYAFVTRNLPNEFIETYKKETENEEYLKRKSLARVNNYPFEKVEDTYFRASKKGRIFATYFISHCAELRNYLKK